MKRATIEGGAEGPTCSVGQLASDLQGHRRRVDIGGGFDIWGGYFRGSGETNDFKPAGAHTLRFSAQ